MDAAPTGTPCTGATTVAISGTDLASLLVQVFLVLIIGVANYLLHGKTTALTGMMQQANDSLTDIKAATAAKTPANEAANEAASA